MNIKYHTQEEKLTSFSVSLDKGDAINELKFPQLLTGNELIIYQAR